MSLIRRIFVRLKAECEWSRLGLYARLYYKRTPLMVYEPPISGGGEIVNSAIWL